MGISKGLPQIWFIRRLRLLLRQPVFWTMTLLLNGVTLASAYLFYYFEADQHGHSLSAVDCIAWSVGLITTIGFGEIVPKTFEGKCLAIFLMVSGTFFIWSYMAVLISAFISPDLSQLETEVQDLEHGIEKIRRKIINLDQHQP